MQTAGGVTKYKYDRAGRVIEVNDIESRIVKYEYNNRGLRTKLTYPDDSNVTYEYDALMRLTKVKYNGATVAEYSYDELSRRTLVQYGNDANIVYQYDLGNQLKRITNNISATEVIDFNYANYDKVGNRRSMKIGDANTQLYSYDKLYQLTYVDYNNGNTMGYSYDKLGNWTLTLTNGGPMPYQSNRLNQYVEVDGLPFQYDKNGNLTLDIRGYRYYYDCENRLTDVNNWGAGKIASFKYDYQGKRVRKTVNAGLTTVYCYDGDQIIADYNDAGVLQKKYIFGPGIDEPICMLDVNDNNAVYYYHYDGLGSVIALSDSAHNVKERYSYDVFGWPTIKGPSNEQRANSLYGNRFMFTGREYDKETFHYYYRARYYDPLIGRFLQPDPIGYIAGLNLYTYCSNNPNNKTDPDGKLWGYVFAGAAVAGVAYGYATNSWIPLPWDPGEMVAVTHGPFTFYGPEFNHLPPVLQEATRFHENWHKYHQWPWTSQLKREIDAYQAEKEWLKKRREKAKKDGDTAAVQDIDDELDLINSLLANDASLLRQSYGFK